MSNIIQLGEHQWTLPAPPLTQDEVLFVKEVPRNQYWRRQTDFPKFFFAWDSETKLFAEHTLYNDLGELISLNRFDSKKLLELRDRELRRRREGVWFMNNGELTHLTGGHYFMLQWGQLMGYINPRDNQPYGEYREFQRDVHYFLKLCKDDTDCLGAYFLKPKKTGVTQLLALDYLDESTRMRGRWFGMMSKTLVPDCRDVNFGMYKHGLENLPNIMKPSIANENLTMIFYGNPVNNKNNNRRNKAKASGNLEWLNTRVTALPTKDNGFDGGKPFRAWTDELPKYEDPYPEDVIKKTSPTCKMQSQITGKWWVSSYTPENDKKNKEQAEKFYYECKVRTRNLKTNRTTSELYAYFLSVLDSAENSFDIYGKTDRRKNQIWVNNELEKCGKDKDAIQSFHRVSPTTEDEAWRSGGAGGSVFDNIRLSLRKFEIEEAQRVGGLLYTEANLVWTDESKTRVAIVPMTEKDKLNGKEGLFRFYQMDKWRQSSLNEFVTKDLKDQQGRWKPAEIVRHVGSMDPTNYSLGKLVLQGSKNSMWVFSLPDSEVNAAHKTNCTGRHIAEYLYRHNRPSDTLDDLKKLIFLFGCPVAIEGNMSWAITKLIEDGLQNFVLVRDTKTKAIVPYDPNTHQSMITTQRNASSSSIDEMIRATQEYVAEPETEDEFDNLNNVDSEVVLKQLMELDPLDTKKSDHAIGFMIGVQTMYNYSAYQKRMAGYKSKFDPAVLLHVMEVIME